MKKFILFVLAMLIFPASAVCLAEAEAVEQFPKEHWSYTYYTYMSERGYLPPAFATDPHRIATSSDATEILRLMLRRTGAEPESAHLDTPIKRAELFEFAVKYTLESGRRFLKLGDMPEFSDWDTIDTRLRYPIELLARAGVVSGKNGNAALTDNATTAEMLKVFAVTEQLSTVCPDALPIADDGTTKILAQNGTTGKVYEVTDSAVASEIIELINRGKYSFQCKEDIPNRGGWYMRVQIMWNEHIIFDYTINNGTLGTKYGVHHLGISQETQLLDLLASIAA
jgi:hypothetical protein